MGFLDFIKKTLTLQKTITKFRDSPTGVAVRVAALTGGLVPGLAVPILKQIIKPTIFLGGKVAKAPFKTAGAIIAAPLVVGAAIQRPEAVKEAAKFVVSPTKAKERFELGKDIAAGKDIDIGKAFKIGGAAALAGVVITQAPKVLRKVQDIIPDKQVLPTPSIAEVVPVVSGVPLENAGELNPAILPETVDITPKKRKRRSSRPSKPQIRITNNNFIKLNNYVC